MIPRKNQRIGACHRSAAEAEQWCEFYERIRPEEGASDRGEPWLEGFDRRYRRDVEWRR